MSFTTDGACIMAELCFHCFVHFDCFPIYIFGFHRYQCASNQEDFTFVKSTSQLFSSADESLKDKNASAIALWDGSVATLHTFCSYIMFIYTYNIYIFIYIYIYIYIYLWRSTNPLQLVCSKCLYYRLILSPCKLSFCSTILLSILCVMVF